MANLPAGDSSPICVVVGAGTKYASNAAYFGDSPNQDMPADVRWGLGGALPIAFAQAGYRVVAMSRSAENLRPITDYINEELGGEAHGMACDVAQPAAVAAAFAAVRARLGEVDVLCFNAGYAQPADTDRVGNPMGGQLLEDVDLESFDRAYAVHAAGLLACAKEVLPSMREREAGNILVTGNTMSLRGGAKFGVNAPSKFAQRAMTQVMAQEYKPFGVHVAHVIVDGALDAPGMRAMFAERGNTAALERDRELPGSVLLRPGEVADAFVYLAQQPRSVWSHEITLTPSEVTLGQRL